MAEDIDAGVNGLVEYFLVEGTKGITNEDKLTSADGYGTFAISFPHQGQITLVKSLDYERIQKYYLTIVASVSERGVERMVVWASIMIYISFGYRIEPEMCRSVCRLRPLW